jgi:glycosyltransferase involved in cell wall biosynthesis
MRTAIIHYWLVNRRGGERVLEELCGLFPDADLFTHVHDPQALGSPVIARHSVRTTFVGRLPWAAKLYRHYLPLMPLALEELDLRGYDLVLSSESGPAKGVITAPGTLHLCYCHSPMRYAWDLYHEYVGGFSPLRRAFVSPLLHYMRLWDQASANRVDCFVANSEHVAGRIRKCYRRESRVVHPPVDLSLARHDRPREDFYLFVGELVPYKRADLAVEACNRLGRRLVVIGGGPLEKRLRNLAGPTVTFLGRQSGATLAEHYGRCRALLFPGLEDFGITPLEAMASGAPVLALGRGGVLESVREGETGLFFREQSAEGLAAAIQDFERRGVRLSAGDIAAHAAAWDAPRFRGAMSALIDEALAGARW